ncbi:16S rRNA (guanine(527)-N(7))-methyltransferase RsmG [Ructibacterium gallinarum]|uniref:Ribosomal RNA small subunit methyltransferase G n=1 Tax=Ructibacterium gallinarum TaxID=2779355 RepID=A0A9D5R7R3_9FIRM|nr:16S rRNA (guanine(527)-N(7))-methyltransferase RsmG [Ructibacterium gallinarum]MBE5039132.1 16S rRNA (guanine(527)-N(7))-methyltransferase RsmG [Ructibacterium gallinarum]
MDQEIFLKGMSRLGVSVTEQQLQQFHTYSEMLKEWNEKMNLTAITEDKEIAVKHFLDSVLPLYTLPLPETGRMIDVGTGAGFPGLPMKIMRPQYEITLADALKKRVGFLEAVCGELNLSGVSCVHGRAEEMGKQSRWRETFDIAVSRAVANMTVLCEYTLPLVRVGGVFAALKAENAEDELNHARPMIGELGGKVEQVLKAALPESDIVRTLILIRKEKNTPSRFPRRADKIKTALR